jgi:hypothetical protein
VIEKLRQRGMDLEVKGEVGVFLGEHIERNVVENTITLTQAGLIKRIIEALDIGDLPIKQTPAAADPLVKDENGEQPDCQQCRWYAPIPSKSFSSQHYLCSKPMCMICPQSKTIA